MNEKLDGGGKAEGESKVDEVGVLYNETVRRGIWPQKGNTVSGKSKATNCKNLAQKVL